MVQLRDDVVGPRLRDPHGAPGLGGERPRRHLHRPARRLPQLQGAVPGRPAARVGRLPELRRQGLVHRGPPVQPDVQDPRRPGRGRRRRSPTCARRRRRASSSTSRTCRRPPRKKPPFGIAQIGKSFRNEITPGNFIFRTREFEQMEMEFFVPPEDGRAVVRVLGRGAVPLVHRARHPRGHAAAPPARPRRAVALLAPARPTSSSTYPWGWGELEGIANRTDFDLTQHARVLGRGPHLLRPGARTRRYMPVRDRAGRGRRPGDARVPARRVRRGGACKGREAHRAAPRPPPGADQGRGAAAVEEREAGAASPTRSPRRCDRTS